MLMVNENRPECRDDFSPEDNAVISSKDVLDYLLTPQEGKDVSSILSLLSKDNPKVTKMLAKTHTKASNQRSAAAVEEAFAKIYEFLKTDDNMR